MFIGFKRVLEKVNAYIQKQYSLDARALSWMRICLGLVLITDWLIRWNSLSAHYTNSGIMPQQLLFEYQWKDGFYSLFILSDSLAWNHFLFGLGLLFSFFFTIGYLTRFSNLLTWILLCSVHARNPFILQGGDELLRIALLWSLFLPLGRYYSVDAIQHPKTSRNHVVFSMASFGFMLLVFGVYFFSALQKTSHEWHASGTAIYYALSLDQMVLPLGKVLLNYPELCKLLTHYVYYLELIGPLLFFIPYKNNFFRLIAIILLILLHLGICCTLFVGLFFTIGISTLIGLVPGPTVETVIRRLPHFIKRIKIASFFSKLLPSFTSLQNSITGIVNFMTNFYTQTILTFSLLFIICISIIWNLGNLPGTGITVSGPFRRMVFFLRLDENWGMFSPGVFKDDGWFVLEGLTFENKKIDIYKNGDPISYQKPSRVLDYIQDDRWRKYGENYVMSDYEYIRPTYCHYMFKWWNTRHSKERQIKSLQVIYMKETTLPDYKTSKVSKEILCTCNN